MEALINSESRRGTHPAAASVPVASVEAAYATTCPRPRRPISCLTREGASGTNGARSSMARDTPARAVAYHATRRERVMTTSAPRTAASSAASSSSSSFPTLASLLALLGGSARTTQRPWGRRLQTRPPRPLRAPLRATLRAPLRGPLRATQSSNDRACKGVVRRAGAVRTRQWPCGGGHAGGGHEDLSDVHSAAHEAQRVVYRMHGVGCDGERRKRGHTRTDRLEECARRVGLSSMSTSMCAAETLMPLRKGAREMAVPS